MPRHAAAQLRGIGPIGASALVASVGDFSQFKTGAQFGAWLGLVPRQHSSGGKTSLGGITKRGDDYLRTLLIQGAKSAVHKARPDGDGLQRWIVQLKERVGLAESGGGAGQQECPHPVGGAGTGQGLRWRLCVGEAGWGCRTIDWVTAMNE